MVSQSKRRRFQFSLAGLLIAQTIASVVLGLWKGLGAGILLAAFLFGATVLLLVAGTVGIASDFERAQKVGRRVVQALMLVAAAVALVVLIRVVLEMLQRLF